MGTAGEGLGTSCYKPSYGRTAGRGDGHLWELNSPRRRRRRNERRGAKCLLRSHDEIPDTLHSPS